MTKLRRRRFLGLLAASWISGGLPVSAQRPDMADLASQLAGFPVTVVPDLIYADLQQIAQRMGQRSLQQLVLEWPQARDVYQRVLKTLYSGPLAWRAAPFASPPGFSRGRTSESWTRPQP